MTNVLTTGPASDNLVIYSVGNRNCHGLIFNLAEAQADVIYDFDGGHTIWAESIQIVAMHVSNFAFMCNYRWWNGVMAKTADVRFGDTEISKGRMQGTICELNFAPVGAEPIWIPLSEVVLTGHVNARVPKKKKK